MKYRIKPLIDFATEDRLFIAGKYYEVDEEVVKEHSSKVLVRKQWKENNVNCSTYSKY